MSRNIDIYGESPLKNMDTSFAAYVQRREAAQSTHMEGGVPDYAFAMDCELRKKLMQVPYLFTLGKKLTLTFVARQIEIINQQGIAVGPDQFPEIYQMGADCAHRLGISVPNMFIINDNTMNAYTCAFDDISPIVVLHSGIVERLTPGELKCVIAHECGHIHNNHGVLKAIVDYVLGVAANTVGGMVLSAANLALMNFWTRAGEVTADRAAMICADDIHDAFRVNYKLLSGGVLNNDADMNLDALRKQLDRIYASPTRIMELGQIVATDTGYNVALRDHPGELRRIFSELEFTECETFYKWRPEQKKPGTVLRSKAETDDRCKKLVNILDNK